VANDFRLLLNAVAIECPAGFDDVAVAAEWMAPKDEVHALLMLPDVDQFVDQVSLRADGIAREAIAIGAALRMEVNRTAWGHRHLTRLKRKPLLADDADAVQIDRVTEHASR